MTTDKGQVSGVEGDVQRGGADISVSALRAARRRRGWDQDTLADELGVSPATISNWERGVHRPRISQLAALAEKLDVPLDELLRARPSSTLRSLRAAAGLSLADAAAATGLSAITLSRAERASGQVSPRTVAALATLYSLDQAAIEDAVNATRTDRRRRRAT